MKVRLQNVIKSDWVGPAILGVILLVYQLHSTWDGVRSAVTRPSVPPDLSHLHFGYAHVFADAYWLQAIPHFNTCSETLPQSEEDLKSGRKAYCRGPSWLYFMLERITDLSPRFYMAHATGGLALSVMVNDVRGATLAYEKALAQFPNDGTILVRALGHTLIEEKNYLKASSLLQRWHNHGGPSWTLQASRTLYLKEVQKTQLLDGQQLENLRLRALDSDLEQ